MATPFKYYILNEQDLESGALDTRYYTRNQVTTLLNGYVGKITGKSLSTNDYTTSEKNKLAGIEAGAEVNNLSDAQVLDLTDGGETVLHKHNAINTPFTPTGNLSSTNVQTALAELDTEKASKLFATNLVTNGDFSDGTTGWTQFNGTHTASNNTLINTANGANTYSVSFRDIPIILGRKYYLRVNVKSKNSDVSYVQLSSSNCNPSQVNINTPIIDTTYIISYVTTATATANMRFGLYHYYSTSAIANGKTVEWQYAKLADLTQIFGAGKEPTKEQVDWLLAQKFANSWFDGTKELTSITDLLTLVNTKANIAQEAWITPTLTSTTTGDVRYRKNTLNECCFVGTLTKTTTGQVFVLPVGYRPLQNMTFSVPPTSMTSNAMGIVRIYATGQVELNYPYTLLTYDFSSIRFATQ